MKGKVVVIGLDGATFDLIKPWVKEGKLPIFKKVMEGGVWGCLKSTIPPLSAPAWISFMTGKNPGNHGIFDFTYRLENSYELSYITGINQRKNSKNLWRILSDEGEKVGVINVMVTYPPEDVNGFIITGGLTPPKRVFTYPASLEEELKNELGGYIISPRGGYTVGKNRPEEFLKNLYEMDENRSKASLYLMKKYEWNFFMVLFGGSDLIQHEMWKYMDQSHPVYDSKDAKKYGNAILRYYQFIEKTIEEILKKIDGNTTVIFMSDHGSGALHKQIYINTWLVEQGYLKFKDNLSTKVKRRMFDHSFTMMNVHKMALQLGFGKLKDLFWGRKGEKVLSSIFLSQSDVDWSKTKAYSQGHLGQIFLNVRGREPEGIIEPGKEYEEVREEIIKRLYEFEDPEDGKKVIEKVYKKEEVYHGKYIENAPDILPLAKPTYSPIERFQFVSNSLIEPSRASGKHEMNGMVMMFGNNIKKGREIKNASIIDLAPTILYIMGVPIPDDIDGKILADAFEPSFLEENQIRYKDVKTGEIYTIPKEKSDAAKNLRGKLDFTS